MKKKTERKIHRCTCKSCAKHPYGKTAEQHPAINRVLLELNERNRRRFVGVLANEQGRGGTSQVAEITGVSRTTIVRGRKEIEQSNKKLPSGIRGAGAGRLLVEKKNQGS